MFTENGECYMVGKNNFGQLGVGGQCFYVLWVNHCRFGKQIKSARTRRRWYLSSKASAISARVCSGTTG